MVVCCTKFASVCCEILVVCVTPVYEKLPPTAPSTLILFDTAIVLNKSDEFLLTALVIADDNKEAAPEITLL